VRGARRPQPLRRQPWVSLGTACRSVTHDRTVARLSIAWTRQVTVTNLICGVDVSSAALDVRLGRDGAMRRFANEAAGIAELAAFCKEHQVGLVALEATGGYERLAVAVLWGAGIPTAVLNPRAVRRFAEAMGFLEKTDRIDSGIIAWFAEVKRVVPQRPAGEAQRRLAALVTRLRQLTELRTAQNNQRRLVTDPVAVGSFAELLGVIARQIKAIGEEIGKLIATDPLWRQLDLAWREIKGVAVRTVARPSCPRSAPSPKKPLASWPASPRWLATAASSAAIGRSAAGAAASARSCSSSPSWCAGTIPISPPSTVA
jgi:transposase